MAISFVNSTTANPGSVSSFVLNVLYGAQTYDENYHKCGFTPQMLEQLLVERGFTKFIWDFQNYHMFVRAWKNPPAEEPKTIGDLEKGFVREKEPMEKLGAPLQVTDEKV